MILRTLLGRLSVSRAILILGGLGFAVIGIQNILSIWSMLLWLFLNLAFGSIDALCHVVINSAIITVTWILFLRAWDKNSISLAIAFIATGFLLIKVNSAFPFNDAKTNHSPHASNTPH